MTYLLYYYVTVKYVICHVMYMVHGTNHSTNCEPSGIPNASSHIVKNFMVLSLA